MYKAVVFDFDGTIIDTEKHLYDIINKHLSFHGVKPVSLEFYRSHIGGHAQGLHDYIEQQIGLEKKQKIYDEHNDTSHELDIIDTVSSLMKYLKQRHIPMAIATSSYREEIMPTINALGIDEYVDVIVGREDVEAVKPDPELYLTAVQRLNYSPAHCLAIEDSANGATGAMNAGLDVIINTNEMTEAQDFSAITFVGKDVSFEQIKNRFFEPNKE